MGILVSIKELLRFHFQKVKMIIKSAKRHEIKLSYSPIIDRSLNINLKFPFLKQILMYILHTRMRKKNKLNVFWLRTMTPLGALKEKGGGVRRPLIIHLSCQFFCSSSRAMIYRRTEKLCFKKVFSMALKPINIRLIRTSSQPY